MRRCAALLLVLTGCSDPYAPLDSGAFWLFEAPDDLLWSGHGDYNLSSADVRPQWEGKAFRTGEDGLQRIYRRFKQGRTGPLSETARFEVLIDREVALSVKDVFDLSFTVKPKGEKQLRYRFAWKGEVPIEGVLPDFDRTSFAFVRPRGDGRFLMLLVAVPDLEPRIYSPDF